MILDCKLNHPDMISHFTFIYYRSTNMNYFIYISHDFRYELNKLTLLPMCGFIAQLVEHRTGIAEVMGSNPVEALIFFSGFFFPIVKIGKFAAMITLHFHDIKNIATWKGKKKLTCVQVTNLLNAFP